MRALVRVSREPAMKPTLTVRTSGPPEVLEREIALRAEVARSGGGPGGGRRYPPMTASSGGREDPPARGVVERRARTSPNGRAPLSSAVFILSAHGASAGADTGAPPTTAVSGHWAVMGRRGGETLSKGGFGILLDKTRIGVEARPKPSTTSLNIVATGQLHAKGLLPGAPP